MRELCKVKKILKLLPIEGKDRIELAQIDGWQAIVVKGQFQEGELVIFCEPDSVLPKKEEYAFLEKYNYRIKTIKMGGVISQGIVLKLDSIKGNHHEGEDVTKALGVTQYVASKDPEPVFRKKESKLHKMLMRFRLYRNFYNKRMHNKTDFPSFIKKTDEERIQNCPQVLDSDTLWIGTEKLDGCSATYFLKKKRLGYEFGVCSRNLRIPSPDGSVYWRMAEKYDLKNKMKKLINGDWLVIQGECIGPRIQKNVYNLKENQFRVYSIITPKGRLNYSDSWDICDKNQLQHVPLVTKTEGVSLKGMTVNDVLKNATGNTVLCAEPTLREGFVYRAIDGMRSFKAVSPSYLLRHDE